jgi:hypothetical protein
MLSLHSSWKVNAVLLVLRRLGVRRELGVGPVQDQATKGPRLAIHADPEACATASQCSNSSDGDPNGDPRSSVALHARPHSTTCQVQGSNGQDQVLALVLERFGGRKSHCFESAIRQIFRRESFLRLVSHFTFFCRYQ